MDMSPSPSPSPMGDMGGMTGMTGMTGTNILPTWVDVLWIAALLVVLVFHCIHLARMGGLHRWFHLVHIVMIVGMIAMFAIMGFTVSWLSSSAWMWLYAITSAAIVVWMIVRVVRRQPFSFLWILALVQQAAMIYMWAPMSNWVPWVSYALAFYFLIETLSWLLGLCNDGAPGRRFAVGPGDRSLAMPMGHTTWPGRLAMAVMAASMGYMFWGMQLMM